MLFNSEIPFPILYLNLYAKGILLIWHFCLFVTPWQVLTISLKFLKRLKITFPLMKEQMMKVIARYAILRKGSAENIYWGVLLQQMNSDAVKQTSRMLTGLQKNQCDIFLIWNLKICFEGEYDYVLPKLKLARLFTKCWIDLNNTILPSKGKQLIFFYYY